MSKRWNVGTVVGALMLLVAPAGAEADDCGACTAACGGTACEATKPRMIEKTIYVPQWTTETRTVTTTECRPETRTKKITTYKCEPYVHTITRNVCRLVYEQRTRVVRYQVAKPVIETVPREITVNVPHREERTGTRTVCEMVPVTERRIIREDHGHWEERVITSPCENGTAVLGECSGCVTSCDAVCWNGRRGRGWRRHRGCGTCWSGGTASCGDGGACMAVAAPRTTKVWVPKIEERAVETTVMRPKLVQKPYTYMATVCRPETRTKMVKVCHYVPEERTRTLCYPVCTPKYEKKTYQATLTRQVPVTKAVPCTVMVPHQVQKEVQVPVCKMVAKKVMVSVGGDCGAACDGGSCNSPASSECGPLRCRRGLFFGLLWGCLLAW